LTISKQYYIINLGGGGVHAGFAVVGGNGI